jgi:hypothetical protein
MVKVQHQEKIQYKTSNRQIITQIGPIDGHQTIKNLDQKAI